MCLSKASRTINLSFGTASNALTSTASSLSSKSSGKGPPLIIRQRTAPDYKAAGEPQPVTVLAYRVDQFIHTVAQALAEFAGDFHRAGDLSQELDQRAGSPVFLFIVTHGFSLRSPSFLIGRRLKSQ